MNTEIDNNKENKIESTEDVVVVKKKKKRIVKILVITLLVISCLALCFYIIYKKNEKDTEDYLDSQFYELEDADEELGELFKYLEPNTDDFYYDKEAGKYYFSDNFKKAFYKIADNYYDGISDEQINFILCYTFGEPFGTEIDGTYTDYNNKEDVYVALLPFDCADDYISFDEYYEHITKKQQDILDNVANEKVLEKESKTLSGGAGYEIGVAYEFKDGNKYTYQGDDKWLATDGTVYIAVSDNKGGFLIETEHKQVASNNNTNNNTNNKNSNSKYISERHGYKVGSVKAAQDGTKYTYIGNDIWKDSDGNRYVARAGSNNNEIDLYVEGSTGEGHYVELEVYFPDTDSRDPSGWRIGTSGWHEYWDGKTVRQFYEESGKYERLDYYWDNNNPLNTIDYPLDYVIGSRALIYKNFPGTGTDIYGKY